MSNINEMIRSRRLELGMTLEEVGNQVGVGKSTVRKWETGYIENMRRDNLVSLARVLKISPLDLLESDFYEEDLVPASIVDGMKIPVLGVTPCGDAKEAIEDALYYIDISETLYAKGVRYALVAEGDSMFPKIESGDLILVKPTPTVESGMISIVRINGFEATCKKVVYDKNNLTLVPFNSEYDVQTFSSDDIEKVPIEVIGQVLEVRRSFDY